MEKPDVVFSERGWKTFLKFVENLVDNKEHTEDTEDQVSKFVSEYKQYKSTEEELLKEDSHMRWVEATAEFIVEILKEHSNPMSTVAISKELRDLGVHLDYNKYSITEPLMYLTEVTPEIVEQVGPRTYKYIGGESNE